MSDILTSTNVNNEDVEGLNQPLTLDGLLRFSLIILLVIWCFQIVVPFIAPVLWGLIIAVALQPVYTKMGGMLGNRNTMAAVILASTMIAALVVPSIIFGNSTAESLHDPIQEIKSGSYQLRPLPEKVSRYPLLGSR